MDGSPSDRRQEHQRPSDRLGHPDGQSQAQSDNRNQFCERLWVVHTNPLYGWGIRYPFDGWLYNVSGLQAVELTVKGEGNLRIGTDEPETLVAALAEAPDTGVRATPAG